jgi:hypothetical protein
MGKVTEKIILKHLKEEIQKLNIIPPEQFEFRTEHSTTQQLTKLTKKNQKRLEQTPSDGRHIPRRRKSLRQSMARSSHIQTNQIQSVNSTHATHITLPIRKNIPDQNQQETLINKNSIRRSPSRINPRPHPLQHLHSRSTPTTRQDLSSTLCRRHSHYSHIDKSKESS